jgi:hypothetical protein
VQTKANQGTDLYLRADAGGVVNGNVTVDGTLSVNTNMFVDGVLTFNSANSEVVLPVSGEPAGQDCLSFVNSTSGNMRWGIGTQTAEGAGVNDGNDFKVFAYADNGSFLSAPLSITRATGDVTVNTLSVNTSQSVGSVGTAGVLTVLGPAGAGTVYDSKYNRPFGPETQTNQYSRTGVSLGSTPFTATNSGLYSVTMSMSIDANGLSWTNGSSAAFGYGVLAGGGGTPSDSYLVVDSVAVPAVTLTPIGLANYYVKDIIAIINLNAGETVSFSLQTQGAFDLGVNGGVSFFIQPISA